MKAAILLALVLLTGAAAQAAPHVVVLDPGHGGEAEAIGAGTGDHWDPAARKFIYSFNYGATWPAEDLLEHRITLAIARKTKALLERAATEEGFREFRKLLARYGRPAAGDAFPRPDFRLILTRTDAFDAPEKMNLKNVNRFYRLYDSPLAFADDGKPSPDLYPGRMSLINRARPELAVSIHVNSTEDPSRRGMAAVVTPNGRLFEFLRDLPAGFGKAGAEALIGRLAWFFDRTPLLADLPGLAGDARTYFDEGGATPRASTVTWRYAARPQDFRKREASWAEAARRGGGTALGGDNLRASDEAIRFMRLALALRLRDREPARVKGLTADQLLGPHGRPFARDYAIPLFINAVSLYVETGYLTNREDRRLLARHEDAYAEGLAVAIYSLFYGMTVAPEPAAGLPPGFVPPDGHPLDFAKYRKGGRDYFQEAFYRVPEIPERVLNFRDEYETIRSAKERPAGAGKPDAKAAPKGGRKPPAPAKMPVKKRLNP